MAPLVLVAVRAVRRGLPSPDPGRAAVEGHRPGDGPPEDPGLGDEDEGGLRGLRDSRPRQTYRSPPGTPALGLRQQPSPRSPGPRSRPGPGNRGTQRPGAWRRPGRGRRPPPPASPTPRSAGRHGCRRCPARPRPPQCTSRRQQGWNWAKGGSTRPRCSTGCIASRSQRTRSTRVRRPRPPSCLRSCRFGGPGMRTGIPSRPRPTLRCSPKWYNR